MESLGIQVQYYNVSLKIGLSPTILTDLTVTWIKIISSLVRSCWMWDSIVFQKNRLKAGNDRPKLPQKTLRSTKILQNAWSQNKNRLSMGKIRRLFISVGTVKIRKQENNEALPIIHASEFVKQTFQILILKPLVIFWKNKLIYI